MMAVSEQRCPHNVMRSIVDCPACDLVERVRARAKTLALGVPEPAAMREPEPMERSPKCAAATMPVLPRRAADVSETVRCVAESYRLTASDILGKDRHKNVSEARMVTCWLLRSLTKLSFPEIGRDLRKDHTTVMNGVKKVEQRRLEDVEFWQFTQQLREAVRARIGGTSLEKT